VSQKREAEKRSSSTNRPPHSSDDVTDVNLALTWNSGNAVYSTSDAVYSIISTFDSASWRLAPCCSTTPFAGPVVPLV
jgi:hypothetical protein